MKDQLENFIRQNKEGFNDKIPSEKAWRNIETSVFRKERSLWNSLYVWRAAAILFLAVSVYLFIAPRLQSNQAIAEGAVNEFNDVEAFYFQQISEKVELIDEFQKNEGLNGFTHDFQQLEAMYLVLKEEMKARPSQKVKDALVLNLLVRIDLLNQQLHRLEKGETYPVKKESDT